MLLSLLMGSLALGDARGQPPAFGPGGPMPMPPGMQGAGANPNALIVSINGTQRLNMRTRKAIRTVVNQQEAVARVQPVQDRPDMVLITGLQPGITRITLTDVDGAEESYDVVVQFDVEYLKTLLRRAVPTANINPIPAANNTIILTGNVAKGEDIETVLRTAQSVVLGPDRIVNALRVGGVMQVQLCVVVAQVTRSEFRRMAFDFIVSSGPWFGGSTGSGAISTLQLLGVGSSQLSSGGLVSGTPGLAGGAPSNLFTGVITNDTGFIGFLQALRDENVAKVIAEPRLVTMSGRPASFLAGGEQAVPIPAGLGQVGVQFEEFGTRLNFLPLVLGNGKIHLEVEPEVSNLNAAFGTNIQGTIVPGRDTQRVHTTVELEDGQTFVIGGLIQKVSTATNRKVPILGDLPFLGTIFRAVTHEDRETELVVLVTPRLVDALACDQLPKYLPGQETRKPDDFELFLEGILEAPRGSREVFPGGKLFDYTPAYVNSPSYGVYPCANGHCGSAGCDLGHGPETFMPGQPSGLHDGAFGPTGRPTFQGIEAAPVPGGPTPEKLPAPAPVQPSSLPAVMRGPR
jgi:pilus assembly protein CpaC